MNVIDLGAELVDIDEGQANYTVVVESNGTTYTVKNVRWEHDKQRVVIELE